MARNPGDEDQAGFVGNEYVIGIDDTEKLRITTAGVSLTHPVLSASTATATLTRRQHFVLADATAAEMGLTLPSAATSVGQDYTVKKVDVSTNAVLVSGSSPETVDGSAFKTLGSVQDCVTVRSDGVQWHVVHFVSGSDL